jgi:hypothetical protein
MEQASFWEVAYKAPQICKQASFWGAVYKTPQIADNLLLTALSLTLRALTSTPQGGQA